MTRIGLLSDTHSTLLDEIAEFLKNSDQIWHAGDWGSLNVLTQLQQISPQVKGVYGNIDGPTFYKDFTENQLFYCEDVKVLITHIGGYPGKYQSRVRKLILEEKPQLYISGHSHILKVMHDSKMNCLHLNPGAAGISGFHKSCTAMRFQVNGNRIEKLEIFDKPRNGKSVY